jgi:hypothetical protein
MNVSEIHAVNDYSGATIAALAGRLEGSTELEHFVYREAELDDLWRVIDTALAEARDQRDGESERFLTSLKSLTHEAHDLVGSEQPRAAAERLRIAGHRS